MDANEFDAIRDQLLRAMEDQYAVDVAANEEAQKIGQQKLIYSNEARGTLYSGQPTWERAQLASQGATNLAKLQSNYLSNKMDIWDNITKTLDQINSYNKAAAAMAKAASNVVTNTTSGQSFLDLYNSLQGGE